MESKETFKRVLITPKQIEQLNKNPLEQSVYVILWTRNNDIPKGEKWSTVVYKVTYMPAWPEHVDHFIKDESYISTSGVEGMIPVGAYQIQ